MRAADGFVIAVLSATWGYALGLFVASSWQSRTAVALNLMVFGIAFICVALRSSRKRKLRDLDADD